jgi:23S rRNA (cytosine1962-C5)-methyltransferase
MTPQILLKRGREKSVRLRHPWIFAGALAAHDPSMEPGSTVDILSHEGEWLARGAYNARSQIAIRIWTWKESQIIDDAFFKTKLSQSIALRQPLRARTNAMRIVNAENDGLPGLIIDQYAEYAVLQFLSAGADLWRTAIANAIMDGKSCEGLFERSDADVRLKEGLAKRTGVLAGQAPADEITIREDGIRYLVDVKNGHKTGFYLDQRENRKALRDLLQDMPADRNLELLNAFSYTGAFSVTAKMNREVHVTQIDSSAPALALSQRNYALNDLSHEGDAFLTADVFETLRSFRDTNKKFDVILLDPPKFAFSKQGLMQATRAYKDINWLAMRLLNPGGYLLTFSCSGLVSETLFQQILFSAAMDAGRSLSIQRRLGQSSDHPVRLSFPEGAYLKGFILRAD